MTPDELRADEKTYLATVRAIEIIGEAARHIPDEFRILHPGVPWREIVAMRNILVHNYEGTDPKIVHRTATVNLKGLITMMPSIIEEAKKASDSQATVEPSPI
jgi:uncharacterized protein with HEPN domain